MKEGNSRGSATRSSNVGSKRRGSGRVATDLMENINFHYHNTCYYYAAYLPLFHKSFWMETELFIFEMYSLNQCNIS
jgi:hypothetical protein